MVDSNFKSGQDGKFAARNAIIKLINLASRLLGFPLKKLLKHVYLIIDFGLGINKICSSKQINNHPKCPSLCSLFFIVVMFFTYENTQIYFPLRLVDMKKK